MPNGLHSSDGKTISVDNLGGAPRWHELALRAWLNRTFVVSDGYPVPVVFSSPSDAFAHFAQLWKKDSNPFSYLFNLKDKRGTPLYEPYPSAPKYPLISIQRKGWTFRPAQNYSSKVWRRAAWPTVSSGEISKGDLGTVLTSRMPSAWDFRFQVDHFCRHMPEQSSFVTDLIDALWMGGSPQTWITVKYPGVFGQKDVRMYMDGNPEVLTPDEPAEGQIVEHRVSINLVVEGYVVDTRPFVQPALWTIAIGDQDSGVEDNLDLKEIGINSSPILEARENVPSE